jgi:hypothetical protein
MSLDIDPEDIPDSVGEDDRAKYQTGAGTDE